MLRVRVACALMPSGGIGCTGCVVRAADQGLHDVQFVHVLRKNQRAHNVAHPPTPPTTQNNKEILRKKKKDPYANRRDGVLPVL